MAAMTPPLLQCSERWRRAFVMHLRNKVSEKSMMLNCRLQLVDSQRTCTQCLLAGFAWGSVHRGWHLEACCLAAHANCIADCASCMILLHG